MNVTTCCAGDVVLTCNTDGYLGWKTSNELDEEFWKAASRCEPSKSDKNPTVVEVKTEHGYHIIMVHNRK